MKKLIFPVLLIAFGVLSSFAVFSQERQRLAILPFTGGTGDDGETIAELFSFEREINNVFNVIPRTSSVDAIMREQQFQRSTGLTDSDTIARLGRQLNADYVVAGHIHVLGNSRLVLITIVHVESLLQIAGDYREYRNIEEVQRMIPEMARRIAASSRINRGNLPRLAVLPFAVPASGVDQNDADVLAQILATEVANSGRYAVLPRTSQIQAVMNEHHIQRSGLTDETSVRVIGRALNAQFVLSGNVRRLGQANMFTAQILNVETGSLLVGHVENYNVIGDGLTKMAEISRRIAGTPVTNAGLQPTQDQQMTAQQLQQARQAAANNNTASFNTLGLSIGSCFTDPLVVATARGTFSPIRNLFVEIGCDFGFISEYGDVDFLLSISPFIHLGYYLPLGNFGIVYIGAGAGYMFNMYTFAYGSAEVHVLGANVTAGINLRNGLVLSYTLRTDFENFGSKVAIGYVFMF